MDRKDTITWEFMYEILKKYCLYYGNLDIPLSFKTLDGINYNDNGYAIGDWMSLQKYYYVNDKLSQEKIMMLQELGVNFQDNSHEAKWNLMYEIVRQYYLYYGNIDVSYKFKTKDGINYDDNGYNLGNWIRNQQVCYNEKKLSPLRMDKLMEIGFVFAETKTREDKWELMYELAKNYYLHYGNLCIPSNFITKDGINYNKDGYRLGYWLGSQKSSYKHDKLSSEKVQKLFDIGLYFERNINDIKWEFMYELAKKYYMYYGNLNMAKRFKTIDGINYNDNGYELESWISTQKRFYREYKLSKDRCEKLIDIGLKMNVVDDWQEMYELAKNYYLHYGHLDVPKGFQTKDGITFSSEGSKLGSWITVQKRSYIDSKLSLEKVEMLLAIGMNFEIQKLDVLSWDHMFSLAEIYYNHYGDLLIGKSFRTMDGINFDKDGYKLGVWISTQKQFYKNKRLSQDRIDKLIKIGMNFEMNLRDVKWYKMFELAKTYYMEYDNLDMERDFKTKDGIRYDKNGFDLGNWILIQRQAYKEGRISTEQVELLKTIELFVEESARDKAWYDTYEIAKQYYLKYGNIDLPQKYKTRDGYNLGRWLYKQRKLFLEDSLSEDKIKALKEIGFDGNTVYINSWNYSYELAKKYYLHYGHLDVPRIFKTKNGINYSEDGYGLGKWIIAQRHFYKKGKLSQDRIDMLLQIGMRLESRYFDKIQNICVDRNIDVSINKKVLEHISSIELKSKINFLEMKNIPICNDDGKLNEIFGMSNQEMQERYNVSLEDLYALYNILNRKRLK